MNTGKLSFSNAPIQGERLPVEDIQQMNKVLDEKYKINEAHLDSVENTLNTIKVEDRNNDILAERKDVTLTAIRDLRNSGNLENAAKNIKSIVGNLANDELFQGALYSKQLYDKNEAELDAAYKKNLETGKGGINEEQYKLAKVVNRFYNTKAITRDEQGNIVNYFKAETVPNYQDIQEELLKNIKELKPGTIDYTNMEGRINGTNDKDLINTWNRLRETASRAGAIDNSIFKGISGEKLMVLAQQVLNNDNIQNYINWMSKAKTIQTLGNFDAQGKPIVDNKGNATFKDVTINDVQQIYQNRKLVLGQDSEGHPALGTWEEKTVKGKDGKPIATKTFNVDGWYTANLLNTITPNGINQDKFREYFMREQANAYYTKGMDYSKAFAYGEIVPNHIKDYYLAHSLKMGALKEMLQDAPTYAATYDNSANIQINDATGGLPSQLGLNSQNSEYYSITPGQQLLPLFSGYDSNTSNSKLKPYDVLHNIDRQNPYRNQEISSAVNDPNSFSTFVKNYLGKDKHGQILSNKQYTGWKADLDSAYNAWYNGFNTSDGQQVPGIKQRDFYKPTEISYANSKGLMDFMVKTSKIPDGSSTKNSYNYQNVFHAVKLDNEGQGLITNGQMNQPKQLQNIVSPEELVTNYGNPVRVGFTNGAFYYKDGVFKPYLRMYNNDSKGGSLLITSPVADDDKLSSLIQIATIPIKGTKMRPNAPGDYLFNVAEFNALKQQNHPAVANYTTAPGIDIKVPYRDNMGRIKEANSKAWYDPNDPNGQFKMLNVQSGKIEYVPQGRFDEIYDALSRLGNTNADKAFTNSGARHTQIDYKTILQSTNILNDNEDGE